MGTDTDWGTPAANAASREREGPAGGADLPIGGLFHHPLEQIRMALHHHQCVAQVDVVIGAEAELAAGIHRALGLDANQQTAIAARLAALIGAGEVKI